MGYITATVRSIKRGQEVRKYTGSTSGLHRDVPGLPDLTRKMIRTVSNVCRLERHKHNKGPPAIRITDGTEGWDSGSTMACSKKVKGGVITDRYSRKTV